MERLNLVLLLGSTVFCLSWLAILRGAVKQNLLSHNSMLFWFAISLFLLGAALFPDPLVAITHFLGFEVASNGVFFLAIGLLLYLELLQSAEISRLKAMLLQLTQDVAIHRGLDKNGED